MRFLPEKPRRLLTLAGVLALIVAGEVWYRHWSPTHSLNTTHYVIRSSALPEETQKMADAVEVLHAAYREIFAEFPKVREPHPPLKLNLYRDRDEFRRCNRGVGWAEAYYLNPKCHAYYAAKEVNPFHWMLHEAVHQLNNEVAQMKLARWFDEGLGEYFGTTQLQNGKLSLGRPDPNTYPIWHLDDLQWTGDLAKDIASTNIIPLRIIVADKGGPDIDEHFNLYYLHWWSVTHFLMHFADGKHRAGFYQVIRDGGTPASFERHIGPFERVEKDWYGHLLEQRKQLYSVPGKRAKGTKRD
ncbi:MAG: DUF1570 domain-containing protein [Limisphaerales bacterium]